MEIRLNFEFNCNVLANIYFQQKFELLPIQVPDEMNDSNYGEGDQFDSKRVQCDM